MNKFQLGTADFNILSTLLKTLPNEVYVYGSRATNSEKRFSDIDLYVTGTLSDAALAEIKAKCEESNLSIKVDIITMPSSAFLKSIQPYLVRFKP